MAIMASHNVTLSMSSSHCVLEMESKTCSYSDIISSPSSQTVITNLSFTKETNYLLYAIMKDKITRPINRETSEKRYKNYLLFTNLKK